MTGEGPSGLTLRIRAEAQRLGFLRVGFTPLRASDHAAFYRHWLAEGRHGSMDYLAREGVVEARLEPRRRWPELTSAVVVAHAYATRVRDDGGTRPARG